MMNWRCRGTSATMSPPNVQVGANRKSLVRAVSPGLVINLSWVPGNLPLVVKDHLGRFGR